MPRQSVVGKRYGHRIKTGRAADDLVGHTIDGMEWSVQPAAVGCLLRSRHAKAGAAIFRIVGLSVSDEPAEVPVHHLRCGRGGGVARGPRAANLDGSLVVEEEEELVLEGRSADIAAELVLPISVLFVVAPIPCVEISVAHEFEEAAVPLVGATPGGHGNHAARREAVNGAEVVGDQAKLLGGVGVGRGRVGAQVGVHIGDAVEHVECAADTAAIG